MRHAPSYSDFFRRFAGVCRSLRCLKQAETLDAFTLRCQIPSMATKNIATKIKTICVYCGSGPGTNPRFVEAAKAFGRSLAENGIRLVYGGGSIGLMGAVATSALDHGGSVTGIIPDFLTARENALTRVQEMVVTPDMHRVHHSWHPNETNSNFGFNLPWWDRLLGTYKDQPRDGHEGMTIGINLFREPAWERLDRMLIQPFVGPAHSYPINAREVDRVSTGESSAKATEEQN